MRIRILLFFLTWIQILLLIEMMRIWDHRPRHLPRLHFEPTCLHCKRPTALHGFILSLHSSLILISMQIQILFLTSMCGIRICNTDWYGTRFITVHAWKTDYFQRLCYEDWESQWSVLLVWRAGARGPSGSEASQAQSGYISGGLQALRVSSIFGSSTDMFDIPHDIRVRSYPVIDKLFG